MNAIEQFTNCVFDDELLQVAERVDWENSTVITVSGEGGSADVEFYQSGEIVGSIQNDRLVHIWEIFPNREDLRSSVRKIREVMG